MKCYRHAALTLLLLCFSSALHSGHTKDSQAIHVLWEGNYLDFDSLSHVNREMTKALSKLPSINVTRLTYRIRKEDWSNFPELEKTYQMLSEKAPKNIQVAIRHAFPPKWTKPKKGKWVLIQPWEFGTLPVVWLDGIKLVDEVWVPTHYVKQIYMDSGVSSDKVFIVPNGINPDIFHAGIKPYPLTTEKRFKFLFLGGTVYRKGIDILLNSYMETFDASDDVCLVIKDFGVKGSYLNQTMDALIQELQMKPGGPEILYFQDEMHVEEIAALYAACDCLVHPYRGEGFALPVLEAMACGTPVMVTAGGATDDFVTDSCGWFIPAGRVSIGTKIFHMELAGEGWLLEPDRDSLGAMMRWISEHPEIAREKGAAAAEIAREHWTWDHAAALAAERIRNLIDNEASHK